MSYEEYTPKEVSSLMGLVDTYLRWKNYKDRNDRSYIHYHPSEWGKCLRAQQYKHYSHLGYIQSEFSSFDSKLIRLFDKGHNMHERWAKYFDGIGDVLLGSWKCKNPLCYMFNEDGSQKQMSQAEINKLYIKGNTRIYGVNKPILKPDKCACGCREFEYRETLVDAPELNMRGHADLVFNCNKLDIERFKPVPVTFNKKYLPQENKIVVGDFKTINSRQWTSQIKRHGPHKTYIIQLTIYIHILNCEYGVIMYENKDTSEISWFMVPRNDKWWDIIKWQAMTMMDFSENGKKLPPPRPSSFDSYECLNCEFRKICKDSGIWKKDNLDEIRKYFYKDLL
jgi:hypothetical protein